MMEAMNITSETRIIDLTVGQLMNLMKIQPAIESDNMPTPEKRIVYGIAGIASIFNCSMTTANRIKASGKINKAITQTGRLIVVDADMALQLLKK